MVEYWRLSRQRYCNKHPQVQSNSDSKKNYLINLVCYKWYCGILMIFHYDF